LTLSPYNPLQFIKHKNLLYYNNLERLDTEIKFDSPEPWGLFFQDNATPQMEGLEELHNNIMFYLAIIMFSVS
jgi:cytochrome c oxidase subunit 2